jgi:WD40 repeat protein
VTTEKCFIRPDDTSPPDVELVDICCCEVAPNHVALVTSDGFFRATVLSERDNGSGVLVPISTDLLNFKHPAAGGIGRSFQRVVWRSKDRMALADGMNAICLDLSTFNVSKLQEDGTTSSEWEKLQSAGAIVMRGHKSDISDMQFSADGTQLVTASDDGFVKVWNVLSGECVYSFEPEEGRPVSSITLLTTSGLSNATSCPCVVGTDRDSYLQVYKCLGDSNSLTQCKFEYIILLECIKNNDRVNCSSVY